MKLLLPGSYDPITLGHLDVVRRVLARGDEVHLIAFINPDKSYLFSKEERLLMLRLATEDLKGVTVGFYEGRVVDYARENEIDKIVKGYRNCSDLEYEKIQAEYNLKEGGLQTELIKSQSEYLDISSTRAREAILNHSPLSSLLPEKVVTFLESKD